MTLVYRGYMVYGVWWLWLYGGYILVYIGYMTTFMKKSLKIFYIFLLIGKYENEGGI